MGQSHPSWKQIELLRAVRRTRRLNQRELAAATTVARATIERIEAGRHTPSLATLEKILAATQFSLVVVDADGVPLVIDNEHDAIHDRAGRRFPARLTWHPVTEHDNEHWWGWYRYVPGTGQSQLMPLPPATFNRRTDPRSFKAYIHRILAARREAGEQATADP